MSDLTAPLQLLQEQPAYDATEAAQLTQLAEQLATAAPLPDLRDHAPTVRQLFPEPIYVVGCGSAHIWLHRAGAAHRLAIIR